MNHTRYFKINKNRLKKFGNRFKWNKTAENCVSNSNQIGKNKNSSTDIFIKIEIVHNFISSYAYSIYKLCIQNTYCTPILCLKPKNNL